MISDQQAGFCDTRLLGTRQCSTLLAKFGKLGICPETLTWRASWLNRPTYALSVQHQSKASLMHKNTMVRPFSLGPKLLHLAPKSNLAAKIARAYLNWYRSENNVWADSNGEFWLLGLMMPHCHMVFDVGANFGDWTRQALVCNPNLHIHCFEPASDNYEILQSQNFAENIVINKMAVSNMTGNVDLNLFGEKSPMNSIVCAEENFGGAPTGVESVKCTTLDYYKKINVIGKVDYIKIDVEGAEMNVLEGMKGIFQDLGADAVQFEYGKFCIYSRTLMKDYFETFKKNGFDLYKIAPKHLIRYEKYTDSLDNFQHQNWIAVRSAGALAGIASAASRPSGAF